MNTPLLSLAARERAAGFTGLAGTHVEATIPLTQRFVDMLVASAGADRRLSGLRVTLGANREIGVAVVKTVLGFETHLAVDLRIRGPVDLASDPRLYLIVARPSLTWSAISRIVIAAGLAPPGIEIGRDGVAIDLHVLASHAAAADLLSMVQTIGFDSEAGVLRVEVVGGVPEGGVARPDQTQARGMLSQSAGTSAARLPPYDALLQELRGARVRGRIAVGEDLVNEAIGVALDEAREPAPADRTAPAGSPAAAGGTRSPLDMATLARWVRRAGVRFENARIVIEPDVVIG